MNCILVYYESEENKTLSYQQSFLNLFENSELFNTKLINLNALNIICCIKLINLILKKRENEIIVILHSAFSNAKFISRIFSSILKRCNLKKIYFLSNEYKLMPEKIELIKKIKADLVFTQTNNEKAINLYKKALKTNIEFSSNIIVNQSIFNYRIDVKRRGIDIGYRSFDSPWYLGHNEKFEIAEFFKDFALKNNFTSDISLDKKDRLEPKEYSNFLNNCRFQIGTEPGSDYFEITDELRKTINNYMEKTPSDWRDIKNSFFKNRKKTIPMRLITGRHLEAAACGCVQILFEGFYNGYLVPDLHYIPLKKDFSNIEEVKKKMGDSLYCEEIRANGFKLIKTNFSEQIRLNDIYKKIIKHC